MRALDAFRRWAGSGRVIAVFGGAYVVSQVIIASILHPLGPLAVLRVQTALSPPVVQQTFAKWRTDALLDTYARHYYFDFPHPVLYAVFLSAVLAWLLNRNRLSATWNAALLLPLAAAACDLFENVSHLAFLSDGVNMTPTWVAVSGIAAITKWLLAGGSLGLIAVLAVRARVVMGRAAP